MVLVILIALWAIVLVPPYLKDRRESSRTFGSSARGNLPALGSSQRFQPLQHAGPPVRSTGSLAGPAVSPLGRNAVGVHRSASGAAGNPSNPSNVVQLHPVDDGAVFGAPFADEQVLAQAWEAPRAQRAGAAPSSMAAARERRRHVLMALTAAAFATLLLAMAVGGVWVALHVAVDAALVGYVILLVRFRQIAAERRTKVEPIRPPVTEQGPATIQAAPSYLLRSGT